jgi:hypothetical protein
MALPYSFIGKWNYTNPATSVAVNIPMTDRPDWIFVKDLTNTGALSTAEAAIESEWYSGMAQGSYIGEGQTSATPASSITLYPTAGTSGGFTFVDQTNPPQYTKVAITAINGTTGVVSTGTTTGINVGDFIRLINVTSALELSAILFQVTAVSASVSITLGMLATAATAGLVVANGTTGFYQKVYPGFMYPKLSPVLYITQATQAKVYFARPNDYTPGELVDFQIPLPYGMIQLSNLTATPVAGFYPGHPPGAARVLQTINTATESSIVIDYDTTGFTAFQFPTSAVFAAPTNASPAVCFPAGSGIVPSGASATTIGSATLPQSPPGTNLVDSFDNHAQYVMNLGLNVVGAASANMVVMAFKADFNNAITNA